MPKFDHKIAKQIYHMGHKRFGLWVFLSKYGLYFFIVALVAIALVTKSQIEAFLWLVPASGAFLVAFVVRYIVRRPRPNFDGNKYTPLLKEFSFPSAHAAVAFAFASTASILVMNESFAIGLICAMIFFLIANLIALSRLTLGVHYFSDVLAGALLGIAMSVMLITV